MVFVLIPAVLLWDRVKEHRNDWLAIFAISWIALFVSTPIAKGLFLLTENRRTHAGWAIQLSVPAMGAVAAWILFILTRQPMPVPRHANIGCATNNN